MESGFENAIEQFRELLSEQCARAVKLAEEKDGVDFSSKKEIVIGVVDGDGIGPVIMKEARNLLQELLRDEIASGKVRLKDIEGLTVENRLEKGQSIPDDVLEELKSCDVILKGPTTTPNGGTLESANVTLRRELDLFANVRPVCVPSQEIDWIFFRENTEGEYVLGSRGIHVDLGDTSLSMDFKVTSEYGTKRIARSAFEYARQNHKKHVAIVTKANIMKKTDGEFSRICYEMAKEYPELEVGEWYVDIMTANLLNKNIRKNFEVFILPNLYGDIITDEAAQIQGGVGTAGSANIGSKYAMFEAIHGSAPRMVEEGLADYANPSSVFKATEMMLGHIGLEKKAKVLARALKICAEEEKKVVVDGTKNGATAHEFGTYVLETIKRME
jgi:hypothetical protein